jgi:carboxyl-terminal processing protease
MKTVILSIAFFLSSILAYSQTTQQESQKIATFCKLWGFLKYYHPIVAEGKIDWDIEFIRRARAITLLDSKQDLNDYYNKWIDSLGVIPICKKCKNELPDSLKFNLDIAWLSNTSVFTSNLVKKLLFIQQNRNQDDNYYVTQDKYVGNTKYDNERPYKDSVFPSQEMRLLSLSRYWNIINYFYPYKYRVGKDWNVVLEEMIPKFKDAKDTITYHLAMLELTTSINDSHARFVTKYTSQYFGLKWAPFKFKIVDNKAVVTGFYNDTLCMLNDIQVGDVFLKVNEKTINDIIAGQLKYIGASNEATKLRNFSYAIFNGQNDSVMTTFERNGIVSQKTINRYLFNQFNYKWTNGEGADVYKILDGNIGYVNLGLLQLKEVDEILSKLKNTKAIIFDVRNYPNGTLYRIADFLNSKRVPFSRFTVADISYPGVFRYTQSISCGKKNSDAYKGKVVLLFNEQSQSHAEFTLMALQTAPNVMSIGSQTAGADGNVSEITFPGGYKTYMTGIGIYYPNGKETQRIGIVPDIEVRPTIEGIKLGKDEVLEKAIEVINKSGL